MAWIVDSKSGTISSVWNSSLCFQMRGATGGGELEKCDGSAAQKWTLKKQASAGIGAGANAQYQLRSSDGRCITDVSTSAPAVEDARTAARAVVSALVFDVKASLGWENGATKNRRYLASFGCMTV